MRILFVNGRQTPPFFQGGDGVSIHTLLSWLSRKGYTIHCGGKINPHRRDVPWSSVKEQLDKQQIKITTCSEKQIKYMLNDNYTCWMVPDELFDQWLPAWMTSVRPDLVLTQLEDSHRVIPLACQQGNPVFHFVHDTHVLNELSLAQSALLAHVFFNSHFTASTYQGRIQAPSTVLYPAIEHGHYTVSARKPRFITMINPVARKGVHLLDALIKCFPHEPFLLVPGWEPLEIDISCYPHVVLSERTWPDAMQTVYAQTKLLLVPSQYEESFGRVAAEALFSGIPVVASRVGGLPEAIGSGGWLIDDYTEPSAWIKTLAHVLALPPSEWQLRGTAGRAYVQQFAIDRIGTTFERLLLTSWQRTRDPLVRRDISSFI